MIDFPESATQEDIRRFQIYGVSVAIQTKSATVLDSFAGLYGGFPSPAGSRHDLLLRIAQDGDRWRVFEADHDQFGP